MSRCILPIFVFLVLAFLTLPLLAIVTASFSGGPPLAFPPRNLTLRWYENINPEFYDALRMSLIVAIGTTVLSTVVGTLAALALQRGRLPGKQLVSLFCLSPLMVPTLVIGVAAYQFTLVLWDLFKISSADTIAALVLGHTAFCMPFVIRAALVAQAHYDISLEEAAQNLGASPFETFFRVTLPLLMPGIVTGAIFAFLASFDDVPVALMLGGSNTVTLPVKIFTSIEFSFDASVMAVATLVVAGSLALMLVVERLIGLEVFIGAGKT